MFLSNLKISTEFSKMTSLERLKLLKNAKGILNALERFGSIEITRCPWSSWMYRNHRDYRLILWLHGY